MLWDLRHSDIMSRSDIVVFYVYKNLHTGQYIHMVWQAATLHCKAFNFEVRRAVVQFPVQALPVRLQGPAAVLYT